ncbi:ASCH domain-containing protein [Coralloluteibacterium thermophilus]|uniref:ASCH domain-containing protein n=1 Tax=Coralloluteibacterium thermophilum TaxID=2707049 RepID=A0ABV9NLD4_9GAMM
MWADYAAGHPEPAALAAAPPPAWHFCDNEADADTCARLVLAGVKRATSPSLWSFESSGGALPVPGDLNIVTDWGGRAVCVIRTVGVRILRFDEITDAHAEAEGEGDGSLRWWREAHWNYYRREREGTGQEPRPDMPVVFQEFECVFPAAP